MASFLFFAAPVLYGGFSPPKSTDLSVRSLKSENPELWVRLGLDALGGDETVLHLADNADQILQDTLQEVISSLPPAQINYQDVAGPLPQDDSSQESLNTPGIADGLSCTAASINVPELVMAGLKREVAGLQKDLDEVHKDMTGLLSMAVTRRDMVGPRRNMAELLRNMGRLLDNIDEFISGMTGSQKDIDELKRNIAESQGIMAGIQRSMAELSSECRLYRSGVQAGSGGTVAPQTMLQYYLEPLFYDYDEVRYFMRVIARYCGWFIGTFFPSLFYNPMALIRYGPAVDPGVFPARWLQIREIREHLQRKWIWLSSPYFMGHIRRFDNLRLPARLRWRNVLIQEFSFQGAVIPYHSFHHCQLVDSNFKGTQFYRCRIKSSEISRIDFDLETQLQTSTFQKCANWQTITLLLAIIRPESGVDSSWEGLIQRFITVYFARRFPWHTFLQSEVDAVSTEQVSEFIEHSQELITLYPDLFSVALQVMFIVSLQKKEEMAQYRPNIRLLMSHHAADALALISACNQAGFGGNTEAMLEQIIWPETPVALSETQLDYQNNLMNYMQQHGLQPVTTPKDDQCFYHVLAQHVITNEDRAKLAERLRLMIASYLFVYLVNHYALDDLSPGLPVDDVMETKMSFLDNVLSEGAIDLTELLNTAAEAASSSGWAGQITGMVAAIVSGQPVFMVNDHGSNVHVSLIYPDGRSVSGDEAEQALESGQIQNVIPLVYDSVNHWFTMAGAILQTWLVTQGQSTK